MMWADTFAARFFSRCSRCADARNAETPALRRKKIPTAWKSEKRKFGADDEEKCFGQNKNQGAVSWQKKSSQDSCSLSPSPTPGPTCWLASGGLNTFSHQFPIYQWEFSRCC